MKKTTTTKYCLISFAKTASNNQNQSQSGNYCCMSLLNCQMNQKFEFKGKNSHDHDYQSPNEMQASHYKIRFLGKVVKIG
jgi:hypothetical protein